MPAPRYIVSTDKSRLDRDAIHAFLSTCYWSPGIARECVDRAIEHSLCWGVYDTSTPREGRDGVFAQVGFARVVTDRASFAYLCDVFVLESHRGAGLGKLLMKAIMAEPAIRGIRCFALKTRDAHGLYKQFGFAPMPDPTRYMEILDRETYKTP
ncbi:MAG: GNAT family N-acetyltransferase [Phycisphaerales bacterium]|nr:GNAT family N-acetyltransferase [Phycisphaerales bacterium]